MIKANNINMDKLLEKNKMTINMKSMSSVLKIHIMKKLKVRMNKTWNHFFI